MKFYCGSLGRPENGMSLLSIQGRKFGVELGKVDPETLREGVVWTLWESSNLGSQHSWF